MSENNIISENNQPLSPSQNDGTHTTLSDFVFEKTQKTNEVLQEAQRLINLYRQLDFLGTDFVAEYDKMLLSADPKVQLALSGLSCGDLVRQYLKFLQKRHAMDVESETLDNNGFAEDVGSYLPSPDDIPPFQMMPMGAASVPVATASDSGMSTVAFDVENFQKEQQKTMLNAIEQMSNQQSQILTDKLNDILNNTQKMVQERVGNVESMIENLGDRVPYPHVEEYMEPAVSHTPQTENQTSVSEYEIPQTPSFENDSSDMMSFDEIPSSVPVAEQSFDAVSDTNDSPDVFETKTSENIPPEMPVPPDRPHAPDIPTDIEILSEIDLPTGNI